MLLSVPGKVFARIIIDRLATVCLSTSVQSSDIHYLGSDINVSAGCESEVNRCLGRAWGVMDSLDHGCGAAGTCTGGRKSESSGPWYSQSCSMGVRLGL